MKYLFAGEDEHTFQIQHPDGSTFSIAKHAVGPGVHTKIKSLDPIKMADGGIVSDDDDKKYEDYDLKDNSAISMETVPEGSQELLATSNQNPLIIEADNGPKPAAINLTQNTEAVPAAQPSANGMSDAYSNAFAQKEAGITGMASAQEQNAKEQAAAYQAQVDQIAKSQAHYEHAHAALEAEHQQLTDAVMKDKIDPNRMFHNMSTGNKVLAAISVALNGLGSGLTGQPNMAVHIIQKSIDRDIEAQKMELGKKHTLLSENMRRFGDLNTATQMTQLQMNSITQTKIAQAAAKSGSAQAKAQAQMMLGELGLQSAQIKQQVAMRNAASQGGNDPSALVQFIVPAAHQKAVFDEIQRAQDTRRMGETILKSFDQAAKENTVLKTGAGFLRTPASVLALHQSMQPTFKDLEGTVRQAAMDNTFKNITPAPGDLASTIKDKRTALEDYLKSKASAPTAKGFGIDLDKFGSTTTQSAPEIATMNGQRYQKVSGGWKKI